MCACVLSLGVFPLLYVLLKRAQSASFFSLCRCFVAGQKLGFDPKCQISLDFEFGKTSFSVASDGVSSSEGEGEGVFAMTRARKRKVESQRDSFLWDVVVNNDDICFKHILPRLNGTDVKFLYGVNTETRKLIKRSSRASDLKETFKVEEMSSISTLEFAWENKSLWPIVSGTNMDFCIKLLKRINSSCSSGRERRKV